MSSQQPILIVGAGPSGLVLAISLILQQQSIGKPIPIRLIDRAPEHPIGSRGTGLQPRTLELFQHIGVSYEKLVANGTRPFKMRNYLPPPDGDKIAREWEWNESVKPTPGVPYPSPLTESQAVTQAFLRDRLFELGGKVELGVALKALKQCDGYVDVTLVHYKPDGVEEEENVQVRYLVGSDGARGVTRKLLGIPFIGETTEAERLLAADVTVEGLLGDAWHVWGSFKTIAVGMKPLGQPGKFQLQIIGPQTVFGEKTPEELEKIFKDISGRHDIIFKEVGWNTEWRANIRLAETFQVGDCFLTGDAGHCHSPAGGQGLNSSVQDAINLAWKLALVYTSSVPLSSPLLASYNAERMPVIAEMLNITTALHKLAFNRSDGSSTATPSSNTKEKDPMHRGKHLHMIGVNYRSSDIVFDSRYERTGILENSYMLGDSDDGKKIVRAGDRVPDATELVGSEGEKKRLFEVLEKTPAKHTVIVFSSSSGDVDISNLGSLPSNLVNILVIQPSTATSASSIDPKAATVLKDTNGSAFDEYGIDTTTTTPTTYVVVRPDLVIGAFVTSIEGVQGYFRTIGIL